MNRNPFSFIAVLTSLMIGLALAMWLLPLGSVRANPGVLYAAPTAQGSGNCSSWANACTLQIAITNADNGDEIWVMEGVHYPTTNDPDPRKATFILKSGVAIYGGFDGDEDIRNDRDWEANLTILSGDIDKNDINNDLNNIAETTNDIQGSNAHHVVTGNGTDSTAVLDGFVITGGQYEPGISDVGGGVYNYSASPTLNNLVIIGNLASEGGGMHNNQGSSPTLTNVSFINNRSVTYGGGGLKNYIESHPSLQNVVFIGNTAGGAGGGIDNYVSSMSLTNGLFWNNHATYAAGVNANNSTVVLTNVTFHGNVVENSPAAIFAFYSGYTLNNVIMWGDQSPDSRETGIYIDRYHEFQGAINSTYSLIQGCGASGSWAGGHCGSDLGGNIAADPLFLDAANGNLRLGLSSPAIDAGRNDLFPPAVSIDLDGLDRFVDILTVTDTGNGTAPLIDMGAYEAHPDELSPSVVSITRLDPNPTSAASLRYRVIFSEPVYGVTTTDFSLQEVGLSGSEVKGVSGGPRIYTVVVATGTGEGTLRLDVPDTATIKDLATNLISGLPYSDGESYTIDKNAPGVVSSERLDASPTNAASVRYRVTFSEDVTGVGASDFSLYVSGVTGASVTDVVGSGTVYTVTVGTGSGAGTLRLDVPDTASITDTAGNSLADLPFTSGEAYQVGWHFIYLPLVINNTP